MTIDLNHQLSYSDAREIRYEVSGMIRAPRRITVDIVADEMLRLKLPSGAYGKYDKSLTPYMTEPMRCLTSREYEAVIFVGPARTGKTVALEALECYSILCDPSDMMTVLTSQDLARKYSRHRVDRRIRNMKELKHEILPGRGNDNIYDKRFKKGNILSLGWPSIKVLSSLEYKYIAASDYDRRDKDDVDAEGTLFTQMLKRTTTFGSSGIGYVESSPGFEVFDPRWEGGSEHEAPPCEGIMGIYNQGDRRRYYWQCPGCGEYFVPSHDHFHIPDEGSDSDRAKNMTYAPPCCGVPIDRSQKRQVNLSGVWLREGERIDSDGNRYGQPRRSRYASFWLSGPCAAFQTWEKIAFNLITGEKEWERTGSENKLKATYMLDLALPFLSRTRKSQRTVEQLMERTEHFERGFVPPGVRFIIATVDVQAGNRRGFVVQVMGFGVGMESWVIDRFHLRFFDDNKKLPLDPAGRVEDWDVLIRKVIDKTYPLSDNSGRHMPVYKVGCDSGGEKGVTSRAYAFYRRLKRIGLSRKFQLVKGRNGGKRIQISYPDSTQRGDRKALARGDIPLLLMNSDEIKDHVSGNMSREEYGPGYMHFPSWLGSWFFEELCAESRGQSGWNLIHHNAQNEGFDCYYYAFAICYQIGADRVNWDAPAKAWARDWDDNPTIISAESMADVQQVDESEPDDEQQDMVRKPPPGGRKRRVVRSRSVRE